jgi:16S rRNA (adenine1518-N6/adenine1519-N6)-dimethyltransferase
LSRRRQAVRSGAGREAPGAALLAAGVQPSKARGQNFLVQPRIADRIVAAAELAPSDEVLEIGPGLGILSERIVRAGVRKFTMVELDRNLAAASELRFAADPRIRVVCDDVLALDLAALVAGPPIKIVGNLPFNAAAAILRRLCDFSPLIRRMVLMFQREVGERIRARRGAPERSAISVYTALYWGVESHFRVLAGSFHPRPKVDSEVIVFRPRPSPPPFDRSEERAVLETVRAAFSAPRKTIRNPLAHALGLAPGIVTETLESNGIDPSARAAALEVEDFVRIARALVARGAKLLAAIIRDARAAGG